MKRVQKSMFWAGVVLLLAVVVLGVRSLTYQPTPQDLQGWVQQGTAAQGNVEVVRETVRDREGKVLLDCEKGINRLPEALKTKYRCAAPARLQDRE